MLMFWKSQYFKDITYVSRSRFERIQINIQIGWFFWSKPYKLILKYNENEKD